MATSSALVIQVRSEGGFDVTEAQALAWINECYRSMVARSRFLEATQTLATTTIGTATYTIAAAVTDVALVQVGGEPYGRTGVRSLWSLKQSETYLRGRGGVFAPYFDSSGAAGIELYPTPTEAGLVIQALVALAPTALLGGSDAPVIPEDFHPALVDGAIATGLARLEEHGPESQAFQAKFEAAVTELSRRARSRVGSGPSQMQVAGVHY